MRVRQQKDPAEAGSLVLFAEEFFVLFGKESVATLESYLWVFEVRNQIDRVTTVSTLYVSNRTLPDKTLDFSCIAGNDGFAKQTFKMCIPHAVS
jgi:hypothetical protein